MKPINLCSAPVGAVFAVAMSIAGATPTPGWSKDAVNCSKCVDTKDIGTEAVTHKKIKDGTIKNDDLGKTAKASGAAFTLDGGNANIATDALVSSLVLDAPSAGLAIVAADGYFEFIGPNSVQCSVTTEVTVQDHALAGAGEANDLVPFSRSRIFVVVAGETTFNLVCSKDSPADQVNVSEVNMHALFVPNNYTVPVP